MTFSEAGLRRVIVYLVGFVDPVGLVDLLYLVDLVYLVYFIGFVGLKGEGFDIEFVYLYRNRFFNDVY